MQKFGFSLALALTSVVVLWPTSLLARDTQAQIKLLRAYRLTEIAAEQRFHTVAGSHIPRSVIAPLEVLWSQSTGMPIGSFEIRFDPYVKPDALAAIITSEAAKDAKQTDVKPKILLSTIILNLCTTDDQLKFILRHEFYHEVSMGKLQQFVSEELKLKFKTISDQWARAKRREIDDKGSKGFEFFSDLKAQEDGLRAGEDPDAPIQIMTRLKREYEEKDVSRPALVLNYLHASHPDFTDRLDALEHNRKHLQGDKSAFSYANRNAKSVTTLIDQLHLTITQSTFKSEITETFAHDFKNQIFLALIEADRIGTEGIGSPLITNYLMWIPEYDSLLGDQDVKDKQRERLGSLRPDQRQTMDYRLDKVMAIINSAHVPMDIRASIEVGFFDAIEAINIYKNDPYLSQKDDLKLLLEPNYLTRLTKLREQNWAIFFAASHAWASSYTADNPANERMFWSLMKLGNTQCLTLLQALLPRQAFKILSEIAIYQDKNSKKIQDNSLKPILAADLVTYAAKLIAKDPTLVIDQLGTVSSWIHQEDARRQGSKRLDPKQIAKSSGLNSAIESAGSQLRKEQIQTPRTMWEIIDSSDTLGFSLAPFAPLLAYSFDKFMTNEMRIDRWRDLIELYDQGPSSLRPSLIHQLQLLVGSMELAQNSPTLFFRGVRLMLKDGAPNLLNRLIGAYYELQKRKDLRAQIPGLSRIKASLRNVDGKYADLLGLSDRDFNQSVIRALLSFNGFYLRNTNIGVNLLTAYRQQLTKQLSMIPLRDRWKPAIDGRRPSPPNEDIMSYALFVDKNPEIIRRVRGLTETLLHFIHRPSLNNSSPRFEKLVMQAFGSLINVKEFYLEQLGQASDQYIKTMQNDEKESRYANTQYYALTNFFHLSFQVSEIVESDLSPRAKIFAITHNFIAWTPEDYRSLYQKFMIPLYSQLASSSSDDAFLALRFIEVCEKIGRKTVYGQKMFSVADQAGTAAFLTALDKLEVSKRHLQLIELAVSIPGYSASPSHLAQVVRQRLEQNLNKMSVVERISLIKASDGRNVSSTLVTPQYIDQTVNLILASKEDSNSRLNQIGELSEVSTPAQQDRAWQVLAPEFLYKRSQLDYQSASQVLHKIYGRFVDGIYRKQNEVAEHYLLSEEEMKELRRAVFSEDDVALGYRSAEIIKSALKGLVGTNEENLAMIQYLSGKIKDPPQMAQRAVWAIQQLKENYSSHDFRHKFAAGMSLERLRAIYQSNPIALRMVMISDLVTRNNGKGLMATPQGQNIYIDAITSGLESRNAPLAKLILRAFLQAMGDEAHLFAGQSLAASVGGQTSDDVERIKEGVAAKGALFVKILQGLYSDPYLIPDPEVRKKFRSVLDDVGKPFRDELLKMVQDDLRGEASKVRSVRIIKSGSINVTADVTFTDGSQFVGRMVKGSPDNLTRFDMEVMQRMIVILKQQAQTTTPDLARTLKKLANGMDEFLTGIAQKIYSEVDLSQEPARAELLKNSYSQIFTDLNVAVQLVKPAQTPVLFSSHPEDNLADPQRIIFYPYIRDVSGDLTTDEFLRVRRAILKTEWEAIFKYGKYDPDGHHGNWLVVRSATDHDHLILYRIDYSQAESITPERLKNLQEFLNFLFNESNPWIAVDRTNLRQRAYNNFLSLVEGVEDSASLRALFEASLPKALSEARTPIESLMELHATLKDQLDGRLKIRADIRFVLKSLFITYGNLSAEIPSERRYLTEYFMRVVLGRGTIISRLAGFYAYAFGQGRSIPSQLQETAPEEKVRYDRAVEALKAANAANTHIDGALQWQILDMTKNQPEMKSKLFPLLKYQLVYNANSELFEFVRKHVSTSEMEAILESMLNSPGGKSHHLAAHYVMVMRIEKLYLLAVRYADEDELNNPSVASDSFAALFIQEALAHPEMLDRHDRLFRLDRTRFAPLFLQPLKFLFANPTSEQFYNFIHKPGLSEADREVALKKLLELSRREIAARDLHISKEDSYFSALYFLYDNASAGSDLKNRLQKAILEYTFLGSDEALIAAKTDREIDQAIDWYNKTKSEALRPSARPSESKSAPPMSFQQYFRENILDAGGDYFSWSEPLLRSDLSSALRALSRMNSISKETVTKVRYFVDALLVYHDPPLYPHKDGDILLTMLKLTFDDVDPKDLIKEIRKNMQIYANQHHPRLGIVQQTLRRMDLDAANKHQILSQQRLSLDEGLELLDFLGDQFYERYPMDLVIQSLAFDSTESQSTFFEVMRHYLTNQLNTKLYGDVEKRRHKIEYLLLLLEQRLPHQLDCQSLLTRTQP